MSDQQYLRARALLIRVIGRVSHIEYELALLTNPDTVRNVPEIPETGTLTEIKTLLEQLYLRMHNARAKIDVHPQGTFLDIMRIAEKMGEQL